MKTKEYTIRRESLGYWGFRLHDHQGVPLIVDGSIEDIQKWLEKKSAIESACIPPSEITHTIIGE